jgi:pilus assembly protein Flp/PilA
MRFSSFLRDERGVTAIEYALIAGVLSVAIATAVTMIGGSVVGMWETISGGLSPAADGETT